jgi:hypothetical protein
MKRHISKVCRAAHFHIRALRHIRAALTEDMAKMLAASLVQSRIDYANSLIHGVGNIRKLQSVQNSAARVVFKDVAHQPSNILLSKLHWLPVQSRITFKIACLTYLTLTTGQPSYLRTQLQYYTPSRTLRSTNQCLLQIPRVSTETGKRSFSYTAPSIWNKLPTEIKHAASYQTFKRRLKTHLFNKPNAYILG